MTDGLGEVPVDPDVTKLRKLLVALQADVADGLTTSQQANETIDRAADALAHRKERKIK